jgi:hypothetical protein
MATNTQAFAGEQATSDRAPKVFTMKVHSILNLFKRRAKLLAKSRNLQHSAALNLLAQQNGFQHWHEAQAAAKNSPLDPRLVTAVFGIPDLSEAIYQDSAYASFEQILDDQMAGAVACTNAECFLVEDLSVNDVDFDEGASALTLTADFAYSGDQLPDKVYSATAFYLEARIRLFWDGAKWELANNDPLDIISSVSDQELDWQEQAAEGNP